VKTEIRVNAFTILTFFNTKNKKYVVSLKKNLRRRMPMEITIE